jgi:hypothetical protein
MKRLKLKLVYWLMKSMKMRFVAIEMNDKTEELSIQGNMHIMEFDAIMSIIKEIQIKQDKNEQG